MTVAPAAPIYRAHGSPSSYGQGLRCTHPYRAHLDALIREAGHGLAVIDVKASNRPKFIRNLDALNDALVRRVMAGGAGTSTSVASRYTHPLPVRILNGRTRKQATALSIKNSTSENASCPLVRTCRRKRQKNGRLPPPTQKGGRCEAVPHPKHPVHPRRSAASRLPGTPASPYNRRAQPERRETGGRVQQRPPEPPPVAPASDKDARERDSRLRGNDGEGRV